jgi:peptidoglycan/xylan/chitin deacetylase (PgdA/CDA1 family)
MSETETRGRVMSETETRGRVMSEAETRWPNAARAAVLVTVDFDAELFWLRLDPSVAKRPSTRSIGEAGALLGTPRVLAALRAAGVSATWFVCSDLVERYRNVLEDVVADGHCVASRGPGLVDFAASTPSEQREALERSRDQLQGLVSAAPTGFRPPGDISDRTIMLLSETGYRWSSVTRGDDLPVFLFGSDRRDGDSIVDIPRSWDLDDASRFLFNYEPPYPAGQGRIAPYEAVLEDWKAEFDAVADLGRCYVLSLEPQSIGTPGRIGLLEELLAHIASRTDVWIATGDEMNDWWRGTAALAEWPPEEIRRRERERLASPM